MKIWICTMALGMVTLSPWLVSRTAEYELIQFDQQPLSGTYFSEGVAAGDINGDGIMDVVYGPYRFAGPDYESKHEIYPAKPQPMERYADNFFAWIHDFDKDGWEDVFVVGFPGTPAFVYENPGRDGWNSPWKKHEVFDSVANESPHWTQLVGDERPELVCTRQGMFGFATVDWDRPFEPWTFHPISGRIAPVRFGHGLGVGDINGDGRLDVLHAGGWIEQPEEALAPGSWKLHSTKFSNAYGGAEMHAYDVDGDGDKDVITSLAAHDYGLAWYEQVVEGGSRTFREHTIMGALPEHNRYGVVFSEPHSVQLADIDGDGLKDIITGKTYYSHHQKSPQWDAGAVVYWFRLVRGEDGVDWIPYQIAGDTGIGRQLRVVDVNGDELPDIVVGGMKGAHVLVQNRQIVGKARWLADQPEVYDVTRVRKDRGSQEEFDEATGRVPNAIEAESLRVLQVSSGKTGVQKMGGFKAGRWSGGEQLFWSGAKPPARLDLEFEVPEGGVYDVRASFTTARDYAMVQVYLDDEAAGGVVDLFDYPEVRKTGELSLGRHSLEAGKQKISFEVTGANEAAVKSYMVGIDYLRLVPQ